MARWKLLTAHYLNVPGTEWEQVEVDRETGKQARKRYPVPVLLDPKDPADWNQKYRNQFGQIVEGMVTVAYADGAQRGDIVFVGEPTPDMEPLDDEAEAISTRLMPKWTNGGMYQANNVPEGTSFADALIQKMEQQIDALNKVVIPNQAVQISRSEFDELRHKIEVLTERNAELESRLYEPVTDKSVEPLPEADPPTEAELAEPTIVSKRITSRRPSVGAPV